MSLSDLYKDSTRAIAYLGEVLSDSQKNKQELAKVWERSAAFANGNQQYINGNSATAQISGANFLVSQNQDTRQQMFQTNEIEPVQRTLVSYMTRSQPAVRVYPPDNGTVAKDRAEVAEIVHNAKYLMDKERANSRTAAYIALVFGTVIRKDFWNPTKGRDAQIPDYDQLGNVITDPNTGEVKTHTGTTGDNDVAILTPLSIDFDWSYTDTERLPWITESYLMPKEWAEESYDIEAPGYTGKSRDIGESKDIGNSLSILEQMKYATPTSFNNQSQIKVNGQALIREHYIQPSSEMPKGRMIITANEVVVYDSGDMGSPYFMSSPGIMWHPYSFYMFAPYVGRLLGKGMVEGIIPQQMRLNEINGAILMNANTMAKVDVLAAEKQLKKGVLNGMGGNVYTYRPLPGVPPPAKWQGQALPEQFFKERESLIEQIVRQVGTNFAMQGEPPKGVSAAAAINTLLDNANSQQADTMIAWATFHEEGFGKKLRVIRSFCNHPNEDLTDYIRTMNRDLLDRQIENFKGEDLGDGFTVRVEPESMIPKSNIARRQTLMDFLNLQAWGPINDNSPRAIKVRKELLEKFGEEDIEIDENSDVEKATWENDRILENKQPALDMDDNDGIHLSCHISKKKDPKFLERASPQVRQAMDMHIDQHKQQQAQKSQPPPGAGPMPGGPMPPNLSPVLEGAPGVPQVPGSV